jgi:signal peptidase I
MAPTLHDGDQVLLDKVTYRLRPPRVGEVVVVEPPGDEPLAVKRVVALGGSDVGLEDGVLVVDGVARREPELDLAGVDGVYFGPVTVPEGTVFVLGDNRGESVDSRSYGPVPLRDVVGRVVVRLWPPARLSGGPQSFPKPATASIDRDVPGGRGERSRK